MSRYYPHTTTSHLSLWQKVKKFVFETPVEILAFTALVGTIAGIGAYRVQREKEGQVPTSFSEIEATTKKFENQGLAVPALTRFYAAVNDATMKVFESNNIALAQDREDATFARELRTRIDPRYQKHTLLTEYTASARTDAAAALQSLDRFVQAEKDLPALIDAFAKSWYDTHVDHYRTEVYFVTVCSGTGNSRSCSPQMRTRQVYDYTTHSYTYYPAQGERASQLLADYLQNHPDLDIQERLVLAEAVHEANRGAILYSMKKLFENDPPTSEKLLRLANTFAIGSNFEKYRSIIASNQHSLRGAEGEWNNAKKTARGTSYRTRSRHDSGPREFQAAERALLYASRINDGSNRITDGVEFTAQALPQLEQKIRQFVEAGLSVEAAGKGAQDTEKLREEIMDLARQVYQKNFEGGHDVDPFKIGIIILVTMAGMAAGAGLGAGVDRLINAGYQRGYFSIGNKERKDPLTPVRGPTLQELSKSFSRKTGHKTVDAPSPQPITEQLPPKPEMPLKKVPKL